MREVAGVPSAIADRSEVEPLRELRHTLAEAGATVAASLDVARDDAGIFEPLLEIASMRHEFANERLFIS